MSQAEQTSLSCEDFEDRVNELLDQRVSPRKDSLIQRHADNCPPCREIMQAYLTVDDSMKLLKADIESMLRESQGRDCPRRSQISRVTAIVASAALIVLLGLGWGQLTRSANPSIAQADLVLPAPLFQPVQPESNVGGTAVTVSNEFAGKLPTDEFRTIAHQLAPIIRYSSSLPGVRPMSGTVNIAIEYLIRTLERQQPKVDPDLGQTFDHRQLLAAV